MRTQPLVLASTMLAGMFLGCFTDPTGTNCPTGAEGCQCSEDFTCEPGLVCMDGHCRAEGGTDTVGDGDGDGDPSGDGDGDPTGDGDGDPTGDGDGDGDGEPDLCGNLMLDPGEQCDGGPGCTNCDLDNYVCNPINNAGCELPGTKCSYVPPNYDFACLPFEPNPPLEWGESNCYNFEPKDEACNIGLSCTPGQITEQCPDGACCTWYCNRLDPNFDCGTPGDTCVKFFTGPDEPLGLEWLGFCSNL